MDRVFSFLLWPKRGARGPWKQGRKKRGSINYRTDRANEANKMFIIWLWWLLRFWKGDGELEVRTATYGPGIDQSQHAKSVSHIINYIIWVLQFRNTGSGTVQVRISFIAFICMLLIYKVYCQSSIKPYKITAMCLSNSSYDYMLTYIKIRFSSREQ